MLFDPNQPKIVLVCDGVHACLGITETWYCHDIRTMPKRKIASGNCTLYPLPPPLSFSTVLRRWLSASLSLSFLRRICNE